MSDDIVLLKDFDDYNNKIVPKDEEINIKKQDLISRGIPFKEEPYDDIKTWYNKELAKNTRNTEDFKSYIEEKLKYQYHRRTGYFAYLCKIEDGKKPPQPPKPKKFPRWAKIMFGIIGGALLVGIVLSVVLSIVLK